MVMNLENPRKFDWYNDLLPSLKKAGLQFEVVSPEVWLNQLRLYSETTVPEEALSKNPAVKLLSYFAQLVQDQSRRGRHEELAFETAKAQACSPSLQNVPNVVVAGLVGRFVTKWLETWYDS